MIKYRDKDGKVHEIEGDLFVCKDKNCDDVFADDKMRSKNGLRTYKVVWDGQRCRWWLCGVDKAWAVNEPIWEDYKLIEDKENENLP